MYGFRCKSVLSIVRNDSLGIFNSTLRRRIDFFGELFTETNVEATLSAVRTVGSRGFLSSVDLFFTEPEFLKLATHLRIVRSFGISFFYDDQSQILLKIGTGFA